MTARAVAALSLALVACGGPPFEAATLGLDAPDGVADALQGDAGSDEGPLGDSREGGSDAGNPPSEAGTQDVGGEADACGAQVPMQNSCPIPGGEPRTIPGLFVAVYPKQGTCAALPTPPACSCAATYTCACVMDPAVRPCGITSCTEGDIKSGVPLTVQCI